MNNYHQPGAVQDFVAPSGGVVSGGFYSFNGLICCAAADAAEAETFAGQICGVFRVTKAGSQAWGHGASIYLTSGSATLFTTTSGGNTLAGKAAVVIGSGAGETTGYVMLNGLPAASIQTGVAFDIGAWRALAHDAIFGTLAVEAIVTVPDGEPVTCEVIWVTPTTEEVPGGTDFNRRERRRVIAIRKGDVPQVPRGTTIVAVERYGDEPSTWRVDGTLVIEAEHVRVIVVLVPEA